jgi:hypothetical protein
VSRRAGPAAEPADHGLGRSRGGLSTKIQDGLYAACGWRTARPPSRPPDYPAPGHRVKCACGVANAIGSTDI